MWVSIALSVAVLAVYAPALHYGFLSFDDPLYVSKNVEVSRGLTWTGFLWSLTTSHAASWHPFTWLSHMLDVQIYGMWAGGHHLTNVALHIANTLLLFWLLHRMTGKWRMSAIVAALFALHPLHVESVAWIAERKGVLSTFFWILTTHAYFSWVRRPTLWRSALTTVLFALGLMSKTMLITLPFTLLLIDFWPLGRVRMDRNQGAAWLKLVREKAPLFILAAATGLVTFFAQWNAGTVRGVMEVSLSARVGNALESYVVYLFRTVWPAGLTAHYPFAPPSLWAAAGCLLVLLLITCAAVRFGRKRPYLLAGWLWYLVTLAPVIGLIQVGGKSSADRFTYVPLIGVFVIAVWGVSSILERTSRHRATLVAATAVAIVTVVALSAAARNQLGYWATDLALWEHSLQATDDNYVARTNLGFALVERGALDEGAAHYEQALRLNPRSAETHNALGALLFRQGRLEDAIKRYAEAIRIDPSYPEPHTNMGAALATKGNLVEATAELQKAIELSPDNAEMHYNLGFALADQGRNEEAIRAFHDALRLNPSYPEAYNRLGNVFLLAGNLEVAMQHYRQALALRPGYAEAHNNLGLALMDRGQENEAIVHFGRALESNPIFAEAHNNMGMALLKRRRGEEAVAHFRESLRIAPGRPDVINNLGLAYMDCELSREAIACFTEALRIDPSDAQAKQNLMTATRGRTGTFRRRLG